MYSLSSTADRARHMSPVTPLLQPTFAIADRMQNFDPAVQYNALMLAAVVASQALGLDPHEEIERAARKVDVVEGPYIAEVLALRDYVTHELKRTPK